MSDDLPLLGIGLPVAGRWATGETMRRLAARADELGYAGLWTFQRLLAPVDGSLGPAHDSVLDSLVALAHVAACTERIGLGTATICAPFVPPVVLAKATATLDVVSGGRLNVGVGMGWRPAEHLATGVPLERRGDRFEEYLRCLTALWTQDPVEFVGEFYEVPRSRFEPKPLQRPHPPVLVGGSAPAALRRAGRIAQGWIGSSGHDLAGISTSVETVREGARQAGRDPDALRILVRCVVELVDGDPGSGRPPLYGTDAQVREDLAALRAAGVTEVIVDCNLSPVVQHRDTDPATALAHAEKMLDALAPSAGGDLSLRAP